MITERVYDEDEKKPCKTCGLQECEYIGVAGAVAGSARCWEPRVRRPRNMCCVLSKLGRGGNCHGSRCYLWSSLGADGTGTCLIALILADRLLGGAAHGTAVEEGEDS